MSCLNFLCNFLPDGSELLWVYWKTYSRYLMHMQNGKRGLLNTSCFCRKFNPLKNWIVAIEKRGKIFSWINLDLGLFFIRMFDLLAHFYAKHIHSKYVHCFLSFHHFVCMCNAGFSCIFFIFFYYSFSHQRSLIQPR